MKQIPYGKSGMKVPAIALGCMRLNRLDSKEAEYHVRMALDLGANFFDHADIYGGGECEEIFGKAIKGIPRDKLILQTKCGIVPGKRYDFSAEHIQASVEKSLRRLGVDYVDALLLHRPDALMDPVEVAQAFSKLKAEGKVLHFGVSNQNSMQMQLLQKYMPMPICANQLQLSITNCTMISAGINVNTSFDSAVDRDGSVLDFCRLNEITIQPWSPFQYGFFEGVFIGSDKYPELNEALNRVAAEHHVSATTIAVAWLLRHPAKFQPIIGTMNPDRLRECINATEVELSRQEWYDIYMAAGNPLP